MSEYTVVLFGEDDEKIFKDSVSVDENEVFEDNVVPYGVAKCCTQYPKDVSDIESGNFEGNSSKIPISISESTPEIELEVFGTTKTYSKLNF